MADEFGVTPSELRNTSADLNYVSSRVKAVMSSLEGSLSGEGDRWGNGNIGQQFADGSNGYLAQLNWVEGSVEAKTNLLDYYSGQLKQAADSFQQSDEG
jgi:uncharacterized protein YukE